MQPKTLSASSLSNWEDCPAKFKAVNIDFIPEVGKKVAAKTGTSVHYALEHFVRRTCIDKTDDWTDKNLLLSLYDDGYRETFGTEDLDTDEYRDGLAMTNGWYKRTDLSDWEVLAVEEKKRIAILPGGILLTYIFDRIQRRITEDGRRVLVCVDYKTERAMYTHKSLREKLQARIYGLCAAIEFKDWQPDEIWVEMDMLRHTPIGIEIDREENVQTWNYLQGTAQRILDADDTKLARVVGGGCRFCPVQHTCPALAKNADLGGIMSLSVEEMVALRFELDAKLGALTSAVAQLDEQIVEHARQSDAVEWTSETGHSVALVSKSRRGIDASRAAQVLGPDLMSRYGGLTMGNLDKLLKGDELEPAQKDQLKVLITRSYSDPSVQIKRPAIIPTGGL